MSQLLLVGSTLALTLTVVHSWRTRGRAITVAFFLSGALFGVLRGNAIYFILLYTSGGASEGVKPYLPQEGFLPEIGHESIQVAVGWVFAAYLAWTVSELIAKRLPRLEGRVFVIGGLASLFMLAICWCMETTAVAVGWWYWALPTATPLFGNVNVAGMEAWFSVAPDFLIPFLAIACSSSTSARRWLWLGVFPLHLLGHLAYAWWGQAYLVYPALALLVVAPMTFSNLRMARGAIAGTPGDRVSPAFFAGALVIFFGVVLAAALAAHAGPAAAITALPMLMLCLLAWRRMPVVATLVVSALSVGAWAWMGPLALWVLAPAVAFGFLRLFDRAPGSFWLRAAPTLVALALSAASVCAFEADKGRMAAYLDAWDQSDARVEAERPHDVLMLYEAVRRMMSITALDPQQGALLLQRRMPRIVRELEEVVRRDPDGIPPREDLAFYCIIEGRLADAEAMYRAIHRLRPKDPDFTAMLGYLLLREGKLDEAERLSREASGGKNPSVKAMVNLGVILYSRRQDDWARSVWEKALVLDSKQPAARLNLERMKASQEDRGIDLRYLARPGVGGHVAPAINNLAAAGEGYNIDERIRLLVEAGQLDPTFQPTQVNLAKLYVQRNAPGDAERSAWHERRARELAPRK